MTARSTLSLLAVAALCTAALGCSPPKGAAVDSAATEPIEESTMSDAPTHAERSAQSKELVLQAVTTLFADFDAEAAKPLLREDYIQHNVGVPTGAAPVLGVLPALKDSGLAATPHRVIADGDLVVLHSTYTNADLFGGSTLVAFDVFRVQDGQLAEHWDNLQPPVDKTVSGRSLTDGPTQVTDLDQTDANKALVQSFADEVLLGGAFDKLPQYITAEPGGYHQHSPDIGDGLDGLGAGFAALAKAGRGIRYSKVHQVIGEGNFVLTMSEGTMGAQPTAFFDLFRIEDGTIVEHWDTISPIPPASEMAHTNGKF